MAPNWPMYLDVTNTRAIVQPTLCSIDICQEYGVYIQPNVIYSNCVREKQETKKEKIIRVAKEKMYASWKIYNQKTEHIKHIKQICKPQHRINYLGSQNIRK